jgi:diaminopimelate decarboxylase
MNEPKLYPGQPGVHAEIADISGPLCMVSDKLSWDDYIESAEIGDVVVYRQAGAYCYGEGMHEFLMHPLPDEVILPKGCSRYE